MASVVRSAIDATPDGHTTPHDIQLVVPRRFTATHGSSPMVRQTLLPTQKRSSSPDSLRSQSPSLRTVTPLRSVEQRKDGMVGGGLKAPGPSSPSCSPFRSPVQPHPQPQPQPLPQPQPQLHRSSSSTLRDLRQQVLGKVSPKSNGREAPRRAAAEEDVDMLRQENRLLREEVAMLNQTVEDLRHERDLLRGLAEASMSPTGSWSAPMVLKIMRWSEISLLLEGAPELGKGSFGPVHRATTKDGIEVAVKTLALGSAQGVAQFYRELHVLALIKHPNVVHLHGVSKGLEDRLAIVYEFAPRGDLLAWLGEPAFGCLPRLQCALGISVGLQCLHEHGIVHRDLKPANVLLFNNFHPKITDFGISRAMMPFEGEGTPVTQAVGTPGYIAPEVVFTGSCSPASDMFAFGVILLQLLVGVKAPCVKGEHILMHKVEDFQPFPITFPTAAEGELWRLTKGCTMQATGARFKLRAVTACLRQLTDIHEVEDDSKDCVICLENRREQRLPCGHKVLCNECVVTVNHCPMCRLPFKPVETQEDGSLETFISPYRAAQTKP